MMVAKPGDQQLGKVSVHTRQADGSLQVGSSLALPNEDRLDGLHLAANGEQMALVGQNVKYAMPPINPAV